MCLQFFVRTLICSATARLVHVTPEKLVMITGFPRKSLLVASPAARTQSQPLKKMQSTLKAFHLHVPNFHLLAFTVLYTKCHLFKCTPMFFSLYPPQQHALFILQHLRNVNEKKINERSTLRSVQKLLNSFIPCNSPKHSKHLACTSCYLAWILYLAQLLQLCRQLNGTRKVPCLSVQFAQRPHGDQ